MPPPLAQARRLNWQRFFRGDGPTTGPYRLHRRNLYILPTRAGLVLALLLVIMLLGAINYANNLGYLFTFLLASVAVVAILHTYRNLLGLRVQPAALPTAFAGETLSVPVEIDNPGGRDALAVEIHWPGEPAARPLDIPAGQRAIAHLPLHLPRRGRHPLPRFVITGRFPLGLFRAWAHVHPARQLLVYPRPVSRATLPPPSTWRASLDGAQGRGSDDFSGLRPYHAGDSPRHIHWKALARQQGLLTKQFSGDRSEELWLDWASLAGKPTELRLGILTRWVLDAEAGGLEYGLRLPGEEIPPGLGPAHRHHCLEALAVYHD